MGEESMGEKYILGEKKYISFEYYENFIGIPEKFHKIFIK